MFIKKINFIKIRILINVVKKHCQSIDTMISQREVQYKIKLDIRIVQ